MSLRQEKKRKKKRGAADSFPSFCRNIGKEGMTHQPIWEPHRLFPLCVFDVCVFFWPGKGLTEAEIQMAVRELQCVCVCVCRGVIS